MVEKASKAGRGYRKRFGSLEDVIVEVLQTVVVEISNLLAC